MARLTQTLEPRSCEDSVWTNRTRLCNFWNLHHNTSSSRSPPRNSVRKAIDGCARPPTLSAVLRPRRSANLLSSSGLMRASLASLPRLALSDDDRLSQRPGLGHSANRSSSKMPSARLVISNSSSGPRGSLLWGNDTSFETFGQRQQNQQQQPQHTHKTGGFGVFKQQN